MQKFTILLLVLLIVTACDTKEKKQTNVLPHSIEAGPNEKLAKGFVFNDNNENRILDNSEKGIAGVAVSNGEDIVQTNKEDYYEIPVSDDAIIFVIKPKDWMTPVNEDNLPRFFYQHKPDGFPDNYKYKGVEPTGELPDEINFPLIDEKSSEEFKMVGPPNRKEFMD